MKLHGKASLGSVEFELREAQVDSSVICLYAYAFLCLDQPVHAHNPLQLTGYYGDVNKQSLQQLLLW